MPASFKNLSRNLLIGLAIFVGVAVAVSVFFLLVSTPKGEASVARRQVEKTFVEADTLRLLLGSPWLTSSTQWDDAIDRSNSHIALSKNEASSTVSVGTEDEMRSEQQGLISLLYGAALADPAKTQLDSVLKVDSSHGAYQWVAQIYRVDFKSLDVEGTHAGLEADVYAWLGGDAPTKKGPPQRYKYRIKLEEYATLENNKGHWLEVSDRSYTLPVTGPAPK